MTVRRAGSMRFRWNEQNPQRLAALAAVAETLRPHRPPAAVSVEQIHSKTVCDVRGVSFGAQGDGLVSADASFMPVVTVADCVPIFLFDPESGAFGVVHSGWKGTGIAASAVERMCAEYGASARNFCIAIGAHIRDCCY
ncbi:MAG: polyphenol oxidase family protein, partial [Treponemataceae bacterium]|nr:polyphenol oxidase family protein [Treponemataceae bacterium]